MDNPASIPGVAHVIQQAVAPVFLLTGIGAILGVLANRLGRIVDRYRVLKHLDVGAPNPPHHPEQMTLLARSRWIQRAITLCTLSALLICVVIAALFLGAEWGRDPSTAIALLFIAATFAIIGGLLCFLREITLATRSIDLGEP